MKKKIRVLTVVFSFMFLLLLSVSTVYANEKLLPKPSNNLGTGLRRFSDIVPLSDGYMRVINSGNKVYVEYYNDQFQIKSRKSFDMELEYWGGFYAGKDSYYLVEGQKNTQEDDNAEVIRVIRYDTSWNRLGAAKITGQPENYGGDVRYPFDYGCVEMTESNGKLYIVTGHQGYVDDSVGQGHQGFLMIEVDIASMTGQIIDGDFWHSFAQYIESRDDNLFVLEQSDGDRCTKLTKYDMAAGRAYSLDVFSYGGTHTSAWAIASYATVDGMALSADNVLCVGTSIDQSEYDNVTINTPYNIYLTVTSMDDFSSENTTVKYLTHYKKAKRFRGVKITKINDNRFMVSWEENVENDKPDVNDNLSYRILHYIFINGNGDPVSKEFTANGPISHCQPVVKNSHVVYFASDDMMVNFYSIDSESGKIEKTVHRVAGENATWDYNDGVLTISGTGSMYPDPESERWENISDLITKVVIKGGITTIPERAFAYLSKLKEVDIQSGVRKIEKEAFFMCRSLEKITIPSSVSFIGEDILWSGWSWGDGTHCTIGKIYTTYDSKAAAYAKKNGIWYLSDLSSAKISGLKASYTYTGKAIVPKITVKLGNRTLKENDDYTVSCKNNKALGTAVLTVKGTYFYYGKITQKFEIVKNTETVPYNIQNAYTLNVTAATATLRSIPDKNATVLTIPSSISVNGKTYKVTAIGKNAFKGNKKLKTVKLPDSITAIYAGAFQDCTALRTITLGKNLKNIDDCAFANCTGIRKFSIPSKVTKIGEKAFYNMKNLTSFTIRTSHLKVALVGKAAFSGAGKADYRKLTVKVPKNKASDYVKLLKKAGLSKDVVVKE